MDKIKTFCKTWFCRRKSCPYNIGKVVSEHKPGDLLLPVDYENKDECIKRQKEKNDEQR